MFQLSKTGLDLVINFEIGGESNYNPHPEWPGASSGVTIGIGYDLGYNSEATFRRDWHKLSPTTLDILSKTCGLKGSSAKVALPSVKKETISLILAKEVFQEVSVPKFWNLVLSIYPTADQLPLDCQSALWSLVYNRGSSLVGAKRVEMKSIATVLAEGKPEQVPNLIRRMKRIWVGTSIERGMSRRRDAEADLFEQALVVKPKKPIFIKTLRKGDKSKEVAYIQEKLNLPASGNFDQDTLIAVMKFQKDHNLIVDGIVGPKTWSVMF